MVFRSTGGTAAASQRAMASTPGDGREGTEIRTDRAIFTGLVREAVSKRTFARKYAFENSRRDLHNALLCTAPKSHFF